MFSLRTIQHQPIGLDIGHDSVKMLQVEAPGSTLTVKGAARKRLESAAAAPDGSLTPATLDAIRQLIHRPEFHGRNVVAALPRHMVHVKNLRLPMIPAAEIAAAVQFEARSIFPFDTEQARIECIPAGEVRQGSDSRQEVIVLAARNEDVDAFLEQLHRAGVIVDSLDVEPCALFRGVERFVRRREDEQEVYVLVDVGLRRSQVVIGKGHDLSFFKPIDIGGQKLHEAVSRKLGISLEEARSLRGRLAQTPEGAADSVGKRDPVRQAIFDATRSIIEELAREVSLCLRYYSVTFRGTRPIKVRLVGGEAVDPNVRTIIGSILPVPVEASQPLCSLDTSALSEEDLQCPGDWALALGLALRRTTGKYAPKDGKPRDPNTPRPGSTAEVVDLNAAIPASAGRLVTDSADPAAKAAASAVTAPQRSSETEALHA